MRRLEREAYGVRSLHRSVAAWVACSMLAACEPQLVVGRFTCPTTEGGAPSLTENGVVNDGPLPAPWETSFEEGFCGYERDAGFCYRGPNSRYTLVTSPTRTGPFAAAFELGLDDSDEPHQARCVREGGLPDAATYGAWYFIPSGFSDPDNWNLFHFQGGEVGGDLRGSWDVNVAQDDEGQLALYVADTRHLRNYEQERPVALPTDRWFHLEFYLRRAPYLMGEIALFQDGEELIRAAGVPTDDDPFTQWYVGNLAYSLTPARATVYVDDVSIRLEP